jgi:probable HAF family extracellular repeat protein
MRARWTLTGLLALAVAAASPAPVLRAAGPTVTIEDLGPADVVTHARGVNGGGLAVGFGADVSGDFGFSQMVTPAVVPLPVGATSLDALAVNDGGTLTGRYYDASGYPHAFRYDTVANTFTDVPYLSGATQATGQAINATGVVAGFQVLPGLTHGFRQSPGLTPEDIGDLGGNASVANGINAAGTVVGYSRDATFAYRAVRFDGSLHALATLGGMVSVANAINDAGLIVGYSTTATNQTHAVAWTDDSTVVDLGTLGGVMSQATAVSGNSTVVGMSQTAGGVWHACMWQGGTLTDLNDLIDPASGWVLDMAYGVNDHGVIVGDGHLNGAVRAFRLTITSEDDADVTAPAIAWVHATPDTLWPPNNQMVPVTVTVEATDDSGVPPTCQLAGVASPGADSSDMLVTGPMTADLRASKVKGHDRFYTLTVQCTDGAGNVATDTTTVRVPQSASGK